MSGSTTSCACPDRCRVRCGISDSVVCYDHVQVADNLPLYGVCCYMDEMVHRPPSLLKAKYPDCNMPLTRYLVAAPRCYCFLTHYPFFSLHMKVAIRCLLQHWPASVLASQEQSLHAPLLSTHSAVSARSLTLLDSSLSSFQYRTIFRLIFSHRWLDHSSVSARQDSECIYAMFSWTKWSSCSSNCS